MRYTVSDTDICALQAGAMASAGAAAGLRQLARPFLPELPDHAAALLDAADLVERQAIAAVELGTLILSRPADDAPVGPIGGSRS